MTELEINQYVSLGRTKPSSTSLKDRILNFSEGRGLRTFFFKPSGCTRCHFFGSVLAQEWFLNHQKST